MREFTPTNIYGVRAHAIRAPFEGFDPPSWGLEFMEGTIAC